MALTLTTVSSRYNPTGVHKDPAFLNLQLRYLHTILPSKEFEIKQAGDKDVVRCKGNFYKLLVLLGVPCECFWLTLHLNGMTNPSQFTGEVIDTQIVTVKQSFVAELARSYSAKLNSN